MTTQTIRELTKGEFFRLTENGPVWVRGHWCNGMSNGKRDGRYSCTKFDDINHERLIKGDRAVFVGFDF